MQFSNPKPLTGQLEELLRTRGRGVRVKVSDAGTYIATKTNFNANETLVGQWLEGCYVVASYGTPLAVITKRGSIINSTEYGETTRNHQAIVYDALTLLPGTPKLVEAEKFWDAVREQGTRND
ncbi:hypothetical protein SEA_THUNDERCLAP_78 [Arthrobacter phage Thunderclap]|uniref:DUF8033 domain-containing protein n=6 Tax=Amigovirus amigo TaxID=1982100 RepID=A0A5J6TC23_9CAUD|nr:hypothetical protein FDH66_gp26 [Arthrobacter phage Amigo]QFG08370.1 hypothetical protein SEA_YEEZUS_78 [Arthrobacter phage Yeezus]QFG13419.1 hypothetical protein SEA_ICHOR_78 [Arthrobacter phage Ichor]QFG13937.1 hypothetical protein SEA_JAEK_78 [Arthrobacter phage Jaek]QJD51724.1 hypothetical protein SEA_BOERSMA_81 [Arthrobacter phage Boersma]QOR56131.1 hypothetical protein SEA_THUNDERCLAP_78 [Arthrobacter phage Thunderclap]